MKKQKPRLALHMETLRALTKIDLGNAAGGRIKTSELAACDRTDTCGCDSDTGTI